VGSSGVASAMPVAVLRVRHRLACPAHTAAVDRRGVVGEPGRLDQAVGDIHPEAVDAAVEPEAEDVEELLAHPRVLPVEVGLGGVEEVQVPLAGGAVGAGDPGPGRSAEHGLPVVGLLVAVRPLAVAEQVAGAFGTALGGGERLLEPDVLVG
jgi:hypothetical protein